MLALTLASCGPDAAPGAELDLLAHRSLAGWPFDGQPASLRPETPRRFEWLATGNGELVIETLPHPGGRLLVSVDRIDLATSRRRELAQRSFRPSPEGERTSIGLFPSPDDEALPVPTLLALELRWEPDGDGSLPFADLAASGALPTGRGPDIVFVSADTLGSTHMSLYGYPRSTTPLLEDRAEELIVFEDTWANAPWTVPSYMSQFTGLYADSFAIWDRDDVTLRVGSTGYWLDPERVTLAQLLRAAGYRTGAWVDNPQLRPSAGYAKGFEVFDRSAVELDSRDPLGGLVHIAPLVLEWLEHPDDRPAFAFVNCIDVHAPYLPRAPFAGGFADDDLVDREQTAAVAPFGQVWGMVPPHAARAAGGLDFDDPLPERVHTAPIVDAYDEEILALDRDLDGFIEALDARADATLFVLSSDHGEALAGEPIPFDHALPYEETARVPLVFRNPGGEGGGRRVAAPVQLVDLLPTLMELAGAPLGPVELHGRSLVEALGGRELTPRARLVEGLVYDGTAVGLEGWKLVRSRPGVGGLQSVLTHPSARRWLSENVDELNGRELRPEDLFALGSSLSQLESLEDRLRADLSEARFELFKPDRDPEERDELSAREPERLASLKQELSRLDRLSRSARPALVGPETTELDDRMRDELRRLGYLDRPEGR